MVVEQPELVAVLPPASVTLRVAVFVPTAGVNEEAEQPCEADVQSPVHEYVYGAVPPPADPDQVIVCPVVAVVGETAQEAVKELVTVAVQGELVVETPAEVTVTVELLVPTVVYALDTDKDVPERLSVPDQL